MKKLIVSNWKMNPQTLSGAQGILESVDNYLSSVPEMDSVSLVFCPPFIFIEEVGKMLNISQLSMYSSLGAQDIFYDDKGSDTGEISGPMLEKLGTKYVIVGHSERRWKLNEPDEVVNKKLKAVLRNEMVPIVCIGEKERDSNFADFLRIQTEKTFDGLTKGEVEKCIIAYEPVWAISSNPSARPDTPEDALESINIIKQTLNTRYLIPDTLFLYGGSVNSKNVSDFLKEEEIDGVLVGSASLNKEEFLKILSLAQDIK